MERFIILTTFLVFISGCVSYQSATLSLPKTQKITGVYHKVKPKETLWKISKAYNVSLDEIVKVNRIPDAAKIERGQLIFIPGANRVLDINKMYNNSRISSFIWPVKGKVVNYYGAKVADRVNKGIDIQTEAGDKVYASRAGKISFLGELKGYGETIVIEHEDNFSTVYANIVEPEVKMNYNISQGAVIAKVALLDNDRQSFIHFEIRKGYEPQNPLFYLP
jgi:murein DD-endopeptidase MepM/ murein hydrolase activator NlpD